jgi:F-type H+-transporting ATPase subunit epsilon
MAPGAFKVTLLTPEGGLLDCRAASVLLPSHDGMIGIQRNHCPMLCQLGTGIVEVKDIHDRGDNAYFLIDSGFVRVSVNNLTILAYDVTTFEGMDAEQAQDIAAQAKETVETKGFFVSVKEEQIDVEKARMIVKLAALSGIELD